MSLSPAITPVDEVTPVYEVPLADAAHNADRWIRGYRSDEMGVSVNTFRYLGILVSADEDALMLEATRDGWTLTHGKGEALVPETALPDYLVAGAYYELTGRAGFAPKVEGPQKSAFDYEFFPGHRPTPTRISVESFPNEHGMCLRVHIAKQPAPQAE